MAGNALALAVLNEGDAFAGPLRYFDVFVPLTLWAVAERSYWPVFYGLLSMMLAGCPVYLVRNPGLRTNPQTVQMYRDLGAIVPVPDVIASAGPGTQPAIAWFGDRYVIWPVDPNQGITNLRSRGMPVRWYFAVEGGSVPQRFQMVRRWPHGYQLWQVVEPGGVQTK